jgi:beta-lactam-binding protein with PASTA domain
MLKRLGVFAFYAAITTGVAAVCAFLAISLMVERTPEVKVPPLVGVGLAESLDRRAAQRLELEVRGFEYSDEIPENHIIRQKPSAASVIRAGRNVGVVLSRGPERHPVPGVAGLSVEDARIALGEAGLKAEISDRVHGGPEGQVIAQSVEAGTRLLKGKPVSLLVSSGPRPLLLRMPNLVGLTAEKALLQLDAAGLPPGRIEEVRSGDPSHQGQVVAQEPPGGYPVAKGAAVSLSVGATTPETLKVEDERVKAQPDPAPRGGELP